MVVGLIDVVREFVYLRPQNRPICVHNLNIYTTRGRRWPDLAGFLPLLDSVITIYGSDLILQLYTTWDSYDHQTLISLCSLPHFTPHLHILGKFWPKFWVFERSFCQVRTTSRTASHYLILLFSKYNDIFEKIISKSIGLSAIPIFIACRDGFALGACAAAIVWFRRFSIETPLPHAESPTLVVVNIINPRVGYD